MLPLHQVIAQLGTPLAKTMIKAHILTGNDCMSKVELSMQLWRLTRYST